MKKVIIILSTDSDESDEAIKNDLEQEINCCWNFFTFEKIEVMQVYKRELKDDT